jgi:hypothetical protein
MALKDFERFMFSPKCVLSTHSDWQPKVNLLNHMVLNDLDHSTIKCVELTRDLIKRLKDYGRFMFFPKSVLSTHSDWHPKINQLNHMVLNDLDQSTINVLN